MSSGATPHELLAAWLAARLPAAASDWLESARGEVGKGVEDGRFCALLSTASRHVRPRPLAPGAAECQAAHGALAGWNPERWSLLEAARVTLVLARRDLSEPPGAAAVEEAFRYADEGELCALYRSLAFLPDGARFAWRAGEGCRTNMRSVFEAVALDTPYPATHFDEATFNQAVIKCLFIGAPLWRLWGLDGRLSPELARMALDLADERTSAHRPVQPELWLCLGVHGGQRGLDALERELASSHTLGRRAAAYALARAGQQQWLGELLAAESDAAVATAMRDALAGSTGQASFRGLDPSLDSSLESGLDSGPDPPRGT